MRGLLRLLALAVLAAAVSAIPQGVVAFASRQTPSRTAVVTSHLHSKFDAAANAPDPSPTPTPSPSPVAAPVDDTPSQGGGGGSAPVQAAAPPAPAPPPFVVGSYQQSLINGDRAGAGLGALNWSSCLAAIAQQNAYRMAARVGYVSLGGAQADLGCGLGSQGGENVGYWSAGVNDVQLNTMFMNSPEHRANIMGPYHWVATAWATAPNGYAYIAVEFG